MKMKGQWVEPVVEKDFFTVTLNNAMSSMSNPSDIVSDFAYTFTLPVCDENNRLFDGFMHLDSIFLDNTFNPATAMDCVIENDNNVLIEGSCYMTQYNKQKYTFTLVGSLGMCMKKLLNSGWDVATSERDDTYYLMPEYLKFSGYDGNGDPVYDNNPLINRYSVYTSWQIAPSRIPFLTEDIEEDFVQGVLKSTVYQSTDANISENNCYINSIIGFAQTNQGFYNDDEFDSAKWAVYDSVGGQLTILDLFKYNADDDVEIVGDGLTEQQMCQFRSYHQQPYMYVSKLWDYYRRNCVDICGYQMDLDNRWFNDTDPELKNAILMLRDITDDKQVILDTHDTTPSEEAFFLPKYDNYDDDTNNVTNLSGSSISFYSDTFNANANEIITSTFEGTVSLKARNDDWLWIVDSYRVNNVWVYWNYNRPLHVTGELLDANSNVLTSILYTVWMLPDRTNNLGQDYEIDYGSWNNINERVFVYTPMLAQTHSVDFSKVQMNATYSSSTNLTNCRWRWTMRIMGNITPFALHVNSSYEEEDFELSYPSCIESMIDPSHTNPVFYSDDVIIRVDFRESHRSNHTVTFNDLFSGMSPFEQLLKWSKMHNLVWTMNDFNRTIEVKRRSDFYADCLDEGFYDITQLIDSKKELTIAPVYWKGKQLEFGYSESGDAYMKGYETEFGRSYGSKTVYTQDNRTNDVVDIFENTKLTPSLISTSVLRPYKNYPQRNVVTRETDAMISNIDNEKCAGIVGNFYYRRNNAPVSADMHYNNYCVDGGGSFVYISDDLDIEITEGTYCWQYGTTRALSTYVRPVFDIADQTETVTC